MSKLEQIEARADSWNLEYDDWQWLIARCKKLETALKFYGDERNWRHGQFVDISNVIDEDGGEIARNALKETA